MLTRRELLIRSMAIAGTLMQVPALAAKGQNWPVQPVRILVSSGAGGVPDSVARLLAAYLGKSFNQTFIVINRPGANGLIGMGEADKAAADGYTLVWGVAAWLSINPIFYNKLPYKVSDFVPVSQIGVSPYCLYVRSGLGVKTLKGFIDLAKSNPGKLTFGSSGNGSSSQLNMELLKQVAGIDLLHVPYKSSADALQNLASGMIDAFMIDFSLGDPMVQAGRIIPIAVVGKDRLQNNPAVPSFVELGYPITAVGWNGVFYKKGTPQFIIDLVSGEVQKWAKSPEGRAQLFNASLVPTGISSAAFEEVLRNDHVTWAKVIKDGNLKQ